MVYPAGLIEKALKPAASSLVETSLVKLIAHPCQVLFVKAIGLDFKGLKTATGPRGLGEIPFQLQARLDAADPQLVEVLPRCSMRSRTSRFSISCSLCGVG